MQHGVVQGETKHNTQSATHPLACPGCRQGLIALPAGFACPRCVARYPLIAKSIPVLFPGGSFLAVARSFIWLKKQLAEHDARIERFAQERWTPPHWDATRAELVHGLRRNREFLAGLCSRLAEQTNAAMVYDGMSSPGRAGDYNDFSFYLQRDWSAGERSGQESRRLAETLARRLSGCGGEFDSAVVLGAGLGRVAVELCTYFEQIVALDSSAIAALMFDALRNGFSFYHENFANAVSADEQIFASYHSIPKSLAPKIGEAAFRYIIADACAMPVADESVGAVLSIYVTDVLGLDAVLPEAKRVLRDGGLFVHFGPLHYHFTERRRMYPVAALRQLVRQEGFVILEDSFVPTVSGKKKGRMMATAYRNWLLIAKKGARGITDLV